jgi:hypothetical protein
MEKLNYFKRKYLEAIIVYFIFTNVLKSKLKSKESIAKQLTVACLLHDAEIQSPVALREVVYLNFSFLDHVVLLYLYPWWFYCHADLS